MSENVKTYSNICSRIGYAMLIFYAFFTLSAFGVAFFSAMSESFVGEFTADIIYEILSAIAYFLSFSCAAFILCKMLKDFPTSRPIYKSFKPNKWFWICIVAIIAVNFTIAYLNSLMVSSLSPAFSPNLDSGVSDMKGKPMSEVILFFVLSIISTAVVPAICEEYLFRGAILTNLLPFGKTTAIIGSAFLFGLMHQNPLQILYTTLMGVVIGYVYVKTKSIWACMIIHFANNLVTVLEEYLPILTRVEWIGALLDLIIIVAGAIALLLIVLKKDKEPTPEENGSFGVIYDSGMDYEECELGLTCAQKIRRFFSPAIIIYTAICIFLMAKALLSFLGLGINL